MNINTTPMIGHDGKPMTPDQIEIFSLKKANAALQQENTEFKKAIGDLQARVLKLESNQRARWQKEGHDDSGNLVAIE